MSSFTSFFCYPSNINSNASFKHAQFYRNANTKSLLPHIPDAFVNPIFFCLLNKGAFSGGCLDVGAAEQLEDDTHSTSVSFPEDGADLEIKKHNLSSSLALQ